MSEVKIIPIPTRILTKKDDIVDTIEKYTKDKIGPNDVITVAESVVAITQGLYIRPEDLKISHMAQFCCRFIPDYGSLATPHGMESLMIKEGHFRVAAGLFIGFLAKLVGKSGVFYQIAGRQTALIDDVTGTMPPFDKHIVYGPKDPDKVAEHIVQRTGSYGAVVADVNDLKRAAVLGKSRGMDPKRIARILIDNPFGNDDQMTPIVIIKNFASVSKKA